MVEFKQPLTSTSSATDTVAMLCTVQEVDTTHLIASVIDQVGTYRKVSMKILPGKPTAYPAVGERWVISREYGDWMFIASFNVPPNIPNQPSHFIDGGTQTGAFNAVAGAMYTINLPASVGGVTIQLPTAPPQGTCIAFARLDSNFYTSFANITAGGADTMDGGAPLTLSAGNATMAYQGTRWNVLGYGTGGFGQKGGVSASAAFPPNVMARDGSGNTEVGTATSPLHAANKAYVDALLPSGIIWQYGGSAAPTGWLLCDGSAVSRTTYSTLFTAIGTTYGVGDGSTTFNLPNFASKFPRGNTPGPGAGADTHAHTSAAHSHTLSDAGQAQYSATGTQIGNRNVTSASYTQNAHSTGLTSGTSSATTSGTGLTGATDATTPGNTGSASNIPAYTGVNFIIKI